MSDEFKRDEMDSVSSDNNNQQETAQNTEVSGTAPEENKESTPKSSTYSWVNPKVKNPDSQSSSDSSFHSTDETGETSIPNQNQQQENNSMGAQEQPSQEQQPREHSRTYRPYQFSTPASEEPMDKKRRKEKKQGGYKPSSTARKYGLAVGLAVVFGLVAGGVFQGVNIISDTLRGEEEQQAQVVIPQVQDSVQDTDSSGSASSESGNTVADVAEIAMPSVVSITNVSVQEVTDWFGRRYEQEEPSSGSGIIVGQNDTELLIATNNHVVEGATTLSVCFTDNSVVSAQTKGTDPDNDLAVIAVNLSDISEETQNSIKVAALGDSSQLALGEQVVAIGNALGIGQSVTSGYVSAVDRQIEGSETKLIQTDAAINPGNSGGALLNMDGEVIGINSSKYADTDVEGIGFAIPLETAEPILQNLMNMETRSKVDDSEASYLGITSANISSDVAAQIAELYNLPEGVSVTEVEEGGPADEAGIKAGDIITKFDGVSVKTIDELTERLTYYKKGETVEVTISRSDNGEYKEQTVTVTLGDKADQQPIDEQN